MIGVGQGEMSDSRMRGAAMTRGVEITSISRPIRREDFEEFDIILAMDRKNVGEYSKTVTLLYV